MAEASIEATPAISEPVSPATRESRSSENDPMKPLDAALEKISQAADDEPHNQDEANDVVDVGEEEEAEELDEEDKHVEDNGDEKRDDDNGRCVGEDLSLISCEASQSSYQMTSDCQAELSTA